ncbi:kinase-like domain-containing protein [Massariosphaeria phaeospora]|uniref:Kinase-like domain-containing protein n=1 Tax=Massariosphaeria phaeospora TaxID=100035 RepID=A0A7C8I2C8_9PLEO|nr:kinase-like domain-containing protein [Massariosphaeria phaeospora]
MTFFDELAETEGDEEFKAWLSKMIDVKQEIVEFVASRREGNEIGEFDSYRKGSFNLSLVVRFSNGPKAVIRFPKPGHTATCLRDEKVRNEVNFISCLMELTTIPVPRVVSWGTTEESPQLLGPFMIMDYIDGTSLATILKQPTDSEKDEVILVTDVDEMVLDGIYEQLADYMLQLARLDFSLIGAIAKHSSTDKWTVDQRPLTYNMNELATVVSNYPTEGFPTVPFTSAKTYLHALADEHLIHLRTQRNLAADPEDARKRFIARHRFKQLVSRYCPDDTDTGPFKPFCDDLQPTNMLVDPDTLRITAVLDFEFTNSQPSQFAYDPPWWLLLLGPDMWLENHSMEEFTNRYIPRMEQFLRALERVEATQESRGGRRDNVRLSEEMRDSWATGRFWFDYGIRKSFDVDAVYWAALHREGDDDFLRNEMKEEMETFVEMKMEQLKAYDAECRERFS